MPAASTNFTFAIAVQNMATLLGIAFVMHQVGSSLGAWGGGVIFGRFGSCDHASQIGVLVGFGAGVVQILAGGQPAGGTALSQLD